MNRTPEPPPSEPGADPRSGWTLNRTRRSATAMAAAADLLGAGADLLWPGAEPLRPTADPPRHGPDGSRRPERGAAAATNLGQGAGAAPASGQQGRHGTGARADRAAARADRAATERRWRRIFN
jgi:hypothetical protein